MEDNTKTTKPAKKRDRISVVLYSIYMLMLVLSAILVGRILYLQYIWKPDPEIASKLTMQVRRNVLEPERGNILARDGRLLAMSYPRYQIAIDPCVCKEEFKLLDTAEMRKSEAEWLDKARETCEGLATIVGGKSADEYYADIRQGRKAGRRYLRLGKPIEPEQYDDLQEYPLFKDGRYKGGIWGEPIPTRRYPYGGLAYRTVGFVREGIAGVQNNMVGLDGKYNYILHGEEGVMYTKPSDGGPTRVYDSLYVEAVNGCDIRTTLDIDCQDIADRTLRSIINAEDELEAGCCVLMEVQTGAIRAMVNLSRDVRTGKVGENSNLAIGRLFEPGSVWKTTTLMTVLEDGFYTSLDETIPTNHGRIDGYRYEIDEHVVEYEREEHKNRVPLYWGLQHSSNYVFRYLGINHYEAEPKKLIDRLYMYKLGETFDFDLDGMQKPYIPSPDDKKLWSPTDLGQIAMGYSVSVTPIHILNFYNAIANDGKMMKPYLVEDIEKDGKILEKRGPAVLNASICSPAVADTITRGLKTVTQKGGTAYWRMRDVKCEVAGKTGTSFAVMDNGRYADEEGRRKYQGTFVGFFPADAPKYSIICSIYSKPTRHSFQGGGLPAEAVKTIANELYKTDPYWNESLADYGGQ